MKGIATTLAGLFFLFFTLSIARAGDAEDAQIAQRCPQAMAWKSAHPDKHQATRVEINHPTKPKLRQQLLAMIKVDQAARDELIKVGMTSGQASQAAGKHMLMVDAANLKKLKPIVLRHGFPKPTQVGYDGTEAAFLLIQHADSDRAFQLHVLPQLAALHGQGLISGQDLAMLTDRTLRAKDKPQRYGTQFSSTDAHPELKMDPVENIPELDARRASMGMPPIKTYACVLSVEYHKPVVITP